MASSRSAAARVFFTFRNFHSTAFSPVLSPQITGRFTRNARNNNFISFNWGRRVFAPRCLGNSSNLYSSLTSAASKVVEQDRLTDVSNLLSSDDLGGDSAEDEFADVELDQLDKRHRKESKTEHITKDGKTFGDFSLSGKLQKMLSALGYEKPFEIQAKTLPLTLEGRDVIGRAFTGSGKTLAFAIPIIEKLSSSKRMPRRPRALVVAPTRELCNQIHRSIQELDPRVRCLAMYGGDSFERQEKFIRRGIDVVCATPGRLNDHLQRGTIFLDNLEFLCLDEADCLFTPQFKEQLEDVLESSPKSKQTMLFSATMPLDIADVCRRYMDDPVRVDITSNQKHLAPESVEHRAIKAPEQMHLSIAVNLVKECNPQRCIIFRARKVQATYTAQILFDMFGVQAQALHSDISQAKREKVLRNFRMGDTKILVATDVAARGLDIPEVDLVIQVGPPQNGADYYIHRAGRTGRAGRQGSAIMIFDGSDEHVDIIRQVEKMVKLKYELPPKIQPSSYVKDCFVSQNPNRLGVRPRPHRKSFAPRPYSQRRMY